MEKLKQIYEGKAKIRAEEMAKWRKNSENRFYAHVYNEVAKKVNLGAGVTGISMVNTDKIGTTENTEIRGV